MSRSFLSRPMQHAHDDGLLTASDPIFDYGCGRGDDIRTLAGLGYTIAGWDPAHASDNQKIPSPVVNIGYVVNVIEDPAERVEALRSAWKLATRVLIVSARLTWDPDAQTGKPYGDGRLTNTGTFQKYYTQEELRDWIASVTGERPITAAPGIFYVFRDHTAAQSLLARQARTSGRPRLGIAELCLVAPRRPVGSSMLLTILVFSDRPHDQGRVRPFALPDEAPAGHQDAGPLHP